MRRKDTRAMLGVGVSCLACVLAVTSGAALAQTTGSQTTSAQASPTQGDADVAGAPRDNSGIQDIVVTAQKGATGQAAQKVPVSVTAVSAEAIAATSAVNLTDVARLAPNMQLQPIGGTPSFANFVIRGIGQSGSLFSQDSAVSVVVDGMVYDFPAEAIVDPFDAETVELLRGPQGTLFGRNTTGGAVNVRTVQPTNDLKVRAEATIGNYQRRDISGMIAGPLVADKLLAKFSVIYRSRDGYYDYGSDAVYRPNQNNPAGTEPAGTVHGTSPDIRQLIIRPTLKWLVSDAVDFTVYGEYTQDKGGANAAHPIPGLSGRLDTVFGYTPPSGSYALNSNIDSYNDSNSKRVVGELNVDAGVGTFTSVTGYRDVDYKFSTDFDGTPFIIIDFPLLAARSKQFSQELRFASTFSDRVRLTVGGYYDNHKIDSIEQRRQSSVLSAPTAPQRITYLQGLFNQKADAYAVFGNVDFDILTDLTVTAGGRYSVETKKGDITPLTACAGQDYLNCSLARIPIDKTWRNFTPKLGIQYRITPDINAYASYTKGFRSGAYNNRAQNALQIGPADPESAATIELGFKSTFWDRKARFNLSIFRTKYDDIQRSVNVGAVQTLANAASATIKGIEAEATLRPVGGLELNGSFGYLNAKYDRFEGLNLNGVPGIQPEDNELGRRLKFDRVPKFTAYGSVAYLFRPSFVENGITARVDYSYRSSFYNDVPNTPSLKQDAYGLLGANVTADFGRFRLTAFGKNLTKARFTEFANVLIVPIRQGGEPRTYGLTIGYRY